VVPKPDGLNVLDYTVIRDHSQWMKIQSYWSNDCVQKSDTTTFFVSPDTTWFDFDSWRENDSIGWQYTYKGGRMDTEGRLEVDIYHPGRIVAETTLPQGGVVPAIWLYFAERPQDPHRPPRSVIWEVDMFETGPSLDQAYRSVFFSAHGGETYERKDLFTTTRILGPFNGFHITELRWDGTGNWEWYLNGIQVKKHFIPNKPDIRPHIILTFAVNGFVQESEWKVNWVVLCQ
jgi:hypothetical protein